MKKKLEYSFSTVGGQDLEDLVLAVLVKEPLATRGAIVRAAMKIGLNEMLKENK